MIILERKTGGEKHLILLFGVGLIGSSIFRFLQLSADFRVTRWSYVWDDGRARFKQGKSIEHYVERFFLAPSAADCNQIDCIWAAGRGGFGSLQPELEEEEAAFLDVLNLAIELGKKYTAKKKPCFHLVSSAGGVFEGQVNVDGSTKPQPLRPYGFAKLRQEGFVIGHESVLDCCIYRPSSVYGYSGPEARSGLIPTLIRSSLSHKTSRIYGSIDTLRDFVFSDDIGKFIAARVLNGVSRVNKTPYLLATGKPTSMSEVIFLIKKYLNSAVYLQFDNQKSNALNNTFRKSARPSGWEPVSLDFGIHMTAMAVKYW